MTHWGWYWKVKKQHTPKILCEQLKYVDSFIVFKEFNSNSILTKNKNIEGVFLREGYIMIKLKDLQYQIPYEKSPCHFGGFRYFFRCPIGKCNRRMRKLYCYGGLFLCRKCLNLGYYSQRVVPSERFHSQQQKIKRKLEISGGSFIDKPKYMRWSTYEKLRTKSIDYELKSEMALLNEVYEMFASRFAKPRI